MIRRLLRNKTAVTGAVIILVMTLIALAAPLLTHFDPMKIDVKDRMLPPGTAHLMGTDEFGRDVYSRVIYGGRLSLMVGIFVVVFSCVMGIPVGVASAYYKKVDATVMRLMDGLMALPGILLAISIMAVLGAQVSNVIIALTVVNVPRVARVTRSAAIVVRQNLYVEAAEALGAREGSILWKHILPNCLSPVIVQATFLFATAVLSEASLSFLGVGAPPNVPSWGVVLSEGKQFMRDAPWLTLFPGIAIAVVVMGLNLFGDGLRDSLDPRLKDL
jgi:peptide/nickel transport system permease protein